MLLRGRIFLGAKFRLVSSPQTWKRKDHAREVHTFESRLFIWCHVPLKHLTM